MKASAPEIEHQAFLPLWHTISLRNHAFLAQVA